MQKAELALKAASVDELDPSRYIDNDTVKSIVNAALDESAIPQNDDDTSENVGGSGVTQAAYWPNAGEVPQDVIRILTEAYTYKSGGSAYPPDSANRNAEALDYAWKAVAAAGWKKNQNGEWMQGAPDQKAGVQ
jgi:hypothetical protein